MARVPNDVAEFLAGDPIAVAGVSRSGSAPANAIFRKLRDSHRVVIPVNPNCTDVEGARCYPDIASIPAPVHGVIVATHPSAAIAVTMSALGRGVKHIWFHRSFGDGSVEPQAVNECLARGVTPIVGGCPLMYCEPVDMGHRIFRWWLGLRGRVPR